MALKVDEIVSVLEQEIVPIRAGIDTREVGRVLETGDGIARVEGLHSAMTNELLQFEDGTLGLALNLDTREIGVVVLGDFEGIEEGQPVRRTGEVLFTGPAIERVVEDLE